MQNWRKSKVRISHASRAIFKTHVICQIHLPDTGYFCPQLLLCKSSNEKSSEICIHEQFVTRMVRYGGEIENGDIRKRDFGLFWNVFVVTI